MSKALDLCYRLCQFYSTLDRLEHLADDIKYRVRAGRETMGYIGRTQLGRVETLQAQPVVCGSSLVMELTRLANRLTQQQNEINAILQEEFQQQLGGENMTPASSPSDSILL